MFSERLAIVFITVSLVLGAGLGYAVIADYNAAKNQRAVASSGGGGDVAGDVSTDPSATPSADAGGAAGGTGGSSGGAARNQVGLANTQEASGVSHDSITVGGIFDMTGPVDSSVERDTVRAYFNKVNAAGGVNGRKLQLSYCDSQYDNVQTHQCSNDMVSAKVLAIVGWTAPKGENDEVKFLAQQQQIPIVGGLGTPEEYHYPLSYPVSIPFTRYGQGLADELAQNGKTHPSIVYINDVPWVAPVLQALLDALHAKGIHEASVEPAASTDQDYTGHVSNLQQGNPDSLIAALDPFSYTRLFSAMNRVNWHPDVFGGGLDKGNQQVRYSTQLDKAQSLVPFLSPFDHQSNPTVQDYQASVQRYYPNQVPALDIYTQISWTAAQIFVEAVKRAGANLTRATLVQALNSIQNFDTGWSKPISYSNTPTHDPNHCVTFMKHDPQPAPDGTWHTYTDWKCY
jgi:ABC-type branched-subunit amino acid transport system substrate-binding protein